MFVCQGKRRIDDFYLRNLFPIVQLQGSPYDTPGQCFIGILFHVHLVSIKNKNKNKYQYTVQHSINLSFLVIYWKNFAHLRCRSWLQEEASENLWLRYSSTRNWQRFPKWLKQNSIHTAKREAKVKCKFLCKLWFHSLTHSLTHSLLSRSLSLSPLSDECRNVIDRVLGLTWNHHAMQLKLTSDAPPLQPARHFLSLRSRTAMCS